MLIFKNKWTIITNDLLKIFFIKQEIQNIILLKFLFVKLTIGGFREVFGKSRL